MSVGGAIENLSAEKTDLKRDSMFEANPGDVFFTRNTDAVGNGNYGYWNHKAGMSLNGWVVEAQEQPGCVIAVPFENFVNRYPEILCLPVSNDTAFNIRFAHTMITLLGDDYNKYNVFFSRFRGGENCVSCMKTAYMRAGGSNPRWRLPTGVVRKLRMRGMPTRFHKKDYENWVKPKMWFDGMVTDPNKLLTPPE